MKVLLKINGIYGLYLWVDYETPKYVVAYHLEGAKAGDVYDENTNAWQRGTYIHYWDYNNDTLDVATKELMNH